MGHHLQPLPIGFSCSGRSCTLHFRHEHTVILFLHQHNQCVQMTFALFRALALVCRDMIVTQGIMVFYTLLIQLCSGYIISNTDMPAYWIWCVQAMCMYRLFVSLLETQGLLAVTHGLGLSGAGHQRDDVLKCTCMPWLYTITHIISNSGRTRLRHTTTFQSVMLRWGLEESKPIFTGMPKVQLRCCINTIPAGCTSALVCCLP